MTKKENGKVKKWFKRNGDIIIVCVGIGAVCVASFVLGDKYTQLAIANGLEKLHDDGYLKFIDPSTNIEVTVGECVKLANERYSK